MEYTYRPQPGTEQKMSNLHKFGWSLFSRILYQIVMGRIWPNFFFRIINWSLDGGMEKGSSPWVKDSSVVDPGWFIPNPLFRIRIKPIFFKHIWKFNQTEESSITICHFSVHTTVLQSTQSRIHRPKIRNTIFFIYLLFPFLLDPGKSSWSSTV